MKNSKKNVATNKKAYQAALIKKATAKKLTQHQLSIL